MFRRILNSSVRGGWRQNPAQHLIGAEKPQTQGKPELWGESPSQKQDKKCLKKNPGLER